MTIAEVEAAGAANYISWDSIEDKEERQTIYSHKIFVPPYYPTQFCKQAASSHHRQESLKTDRIIKDRLLSCNKQDITKGNAGGSASTDTDGNTTIEVHARDNETHEDGSASKFGVQLELEIDKDGNAKGSAKVSYDRDF